MFDLPKNEEIAKLCAKAYEGGAVVCAVCHGTVGKQTQSCLYSVGNLLFYDNYYVDELCNLNIILVEKNYPIKYKLYVPNIQKFGKI